VRRGSETVDDLQLLDVADVARLLKVDRDVVRAAVKAGHLKRIPIGGPRTWRFRRSEIAAYLDWLVEQRDQPAPTVYRGRGRNRVAVD
jgi:excisionase family DNA binding protein